MQRRQESWFVFPLLWSRFFLLSPGALRISPECFTIRCRERRLGSGADPSPRFGSFLLVFVNTLHLADKKTHGSVLDCLSIKGIMIFSDMSTGTNSPKVHPPNGTRFYTFQASEVKGFSPSYVCGSFFFFVSISALLFWKKEGAVWLCIRAQDCLQSLRFLPACVDPKDSHSSILIFQELVLNLQYRPPTVFYYNVARIIFFIMSHG